MRSFIIESHYANDLPGALIAYATRQPFQHTAVLVQDDTGMLFRYEALVGKGFVKNEYKKREGVRHTEVAVNENEWRKIRFSLDRMVGTKYPKVAYLGLEYLLPFLRHQRRTLYCSQAALMAIRDAGLYNANVNGHRVPKPHPGIVFCVAETLASCRRTDIVEEA